MPKYFVVFDSENPPTIVEHRRNVLTGEPWMPVRLASAVAEFDGDEHLRYEFAHHVLVNLVVVKYKPRDPERSVVEPAARMFVYVHRDRIVAISPILEAQ